MSPRDGPSPWQLATVVQIVDETARAKTFRLRPEAPFGHRAGQHVVVRLTAPDGYTASRSYSIASAPGAGEEVDVTVERLDDGEVSSFLHDEVVLGDELEVRGPIGGWFVWDGDTAGLLVGAGSGVAPLMAMLRLARARGVSSLVRMVVSVRAPDDLYYSSEIVGPECTVVYTRVAPPDSTRGPGRLTVADLEPLVVPDCTAYVCGSTGFANAASQLLIEAGVPSARIRVERFGPSG